jgi:hypothetical protein
MYDRAWNSREGKGRKGSGGVRTMQRVGRNRKLTGFTEAHVLEASRLIITSSLFHYYSSFLTYP